jgi:thioredoxin:protein disulfide reductase
LARALDDSTVELSVDVADGALYRDSLRFAADNAVLGDAQVPRGKAKFDETFQKTVETHRGVLIVRLPVKGAPPSFALGVVSQGCPDAGLCYPPMKRIAKVSLRGLWW